MRAILPHRLDILSPFPSTDALHLFVRPALRKEVAFASPRAAAAARGGAGRRTRHTDSPWRPPVYGFLRTLQPSLIANFDRPVTSIMSRSCVGHAKFLPSKRNREGYIPRTCTASSLQLSVLFLPILLSKELQPQVRYPHDTDQDRTTDHNDP
ncbi:hypothetical protein C4D60_Mb08t28910 [Musa balbisiana]|uniref:Uncharacterized protein n=1 Tax=Musa balbisiana TaxID=52838 RepID=A0A4S8K7B5_MUSBA|nr:hypothetical protein C4D60_Mb08t28910 [Musa balbisiana]